MIIPNHVRRERHRKLFWDKVFFWRKWRGEGELTDEGRALVLHLTNARNGYEMDSPMVKAALSASHQVFGKKDTKENIDEILYSFYVLGWLTEEELASI